MLPVRIRQFPQFLHQIGHRTFVLGRSPVRRPMFHLCYFSCRSYFKYLYCSLHSLVQHLRATRFRVVVFSDEEQPLSAAQIEAILALLPGTRVLVWPKSMGWGAKQIRSIWHAYGIAGEDAAPDDIIARVDSDVFFFNDRVFRFVERSDADLVGDGHFVGFRYCQGGCYFFRQRAVERIGKMLAERDVQEILQPNDVVVEDVAAYRFAQALDLDIRLTWFMMFPDELRNAGRLTGWLRWKFSCVHFVMKNKDEMLRRYSGEILGGDSEDFLRALETP